LEAFSIRQEVWYTWIASLAVIANLWIATCKVMGTESVISTPKVHVVKCAQLGRDGSHEARSGRTEKRHGHRGGGVRLLCAVITFLF